MARALVTGGAGFIGSHIVDRLVSLGHEVAVIDSLLSGKRENVNTAATFVQADVREEAASKLIADFRPRFVFHHAAQMDVRKSVADPRYDADVNIMGILRLLEASEANGVERFIFASSGGTVYGDAEITPTDESAPTDPLSPYGVSKLASEKYIIYYSRLGAFDGVILRYANVYGPRQDPHGEAGVVAIFGGRLLRGEPCAIYGDGEATRDYVNVQDVVDANMAAMARGAGQAVNIGTGRETSVNALYRLLASAAGSQAEPQYREARAGELLRSALTNHKALEVLGWQPKITIEAGIAAYIDYLRATA
jgi:UDP-glucose 4-epimerase